MSKAIRLLHCFGAILTGIVILVLAAAISATNGSTLGVTLSFAGLGLGYLAGVLTCDEAGSVKVLIGVTMGTWLVALLAVLTAIISV